MSHHSDESLDEILAKIREQGLRLTQPRRAILAFLMESEDHPTVEEIHRAIQADIPSITLATVYNNLHFLVDQGLVYELEFSDASNRYDFMGHRHYHIICENCGKIADFRYNGLEDAHQSAAEQTDYKVHSSKLELYGLCADCQKLKSK